MPLPTMPAWQQEIESVYSTFVMIMFLGLVFSFVGLKEKPSKQHKPLTFFGNWVMELTEI